MEKNVKVFSVELPKDYYNYVILVNLETGEIVAADYGSCNLSEIKKPGCPSFRHTVERAMRGIRENNILTFNEMRKHLNKKYDEIAARIDREA